MKNGKSFLLVNDERLSCEIGNVKGGQKSGWSRVEWDGIWLMSSEKCKMEVEMKT